MNLSEILKKNEKKLQGFDFIVRKPEIARNDRPYSEFLLPQPAEITKEILEDKKQEVTVHVKQLHEEQKTSIIKNIVEKNNQTIVNNNVLENTIVISNEYINLAGNERKFMDYICESAIKFSDLEVGPIGIKEIIEEIGLKEKSIKQTINRLKNKKFLKKISKRGKGGWRIFKLDEKIINSYKDIVKKKTAYCIDKQGNPEVNRENNLSSMRKVASGMPKEWEELEIAGLDKFGFTKNHLIKIFVV